jgi:hypothetical protein
MKEGVVFNTSIFKKKHSKACSSKKIVVPLHREKQTE